MKRMVSLALVGTVAGCGLVACTPKPDLPAPVVEEFLAALSAGDVDAAAALTDRADVARADLQASWDGLQAEGVNGSTKEVTTQGENATAEVSFSWVLPRQRVYDYDSRMLLSHTSSGWMIRWQPGTLNPRLGANQHLELRAINAPEASVLSADGAPILTPGTVYRILIDPTAAGSDAATRAAAATVAHALADAHAADEHVTAPDGAALMAEVAGRTSPYSVTTLTETQYLPIKQQLESFPGVVVNPEAKLINVDPGFAPEIMSRVEKIVADDTQGANGWKVIAANANGAQLEVLDSHDPTPAPAIRVSLDRRMQDAAQAAVDLRGEMKAMMVALRPSTGDILAVAQTRAADKDGDIALMGQFPPGSTFKMITAAAGVEDQDLTPNSIVPCPGTMDIGHRIVTNYNAFSKGNVPLESAFAASCNTTFADISSRLQPGQLRATAKQFGLGLDYDVPGLSTMTGSVPEGEELVDRTEAGFGQGKDLASPFGMALVAATAAAGRTPTPSLISGHPTTVNETVEPPSPDVIASLQQMMRAVVTSGTARGMKASGTIHGKTGEAEIAGGSHSWFAGYREEDDIAFATLIVLGGGSESAVAITDHFLRALDEPAPQP